MSSLGQVHRIVRPQPESLRTVWPGEATHFTPWLAENLDWLDDLGLGPLEKRGVEVRLPDVGRNLDILAATTDGRLVAIENQYLKVDHDHLTRGLAYALGLKAKALVVIAEDHAEEFVAIADYLNEAYEQLGDKNGIALFLVKLTVEAVGDSFVPRFSVVSRPNAWRSAVREEVDLGRPTVAAFLESCASEVRANAERIVREWSSLPEASLRVNPRASASVSLDLPYGFDSGARSVYVLYPSGLMTVNRGYLVEFGPFDDTEHDELDAAIAQHFPGISDKPYYPAVLGPTPENVLAFARWVAQRSERASNST
ncbi:MAG: hypothetical protein ACRDWY_15980 [Actinomycetes bacterium]